MYLIPFNLQSKGIFNNSSFKLRNSTSNIGVFNTIAI